MALIKGTIEGLGVGYCINKENWIARKNIMVEFLNQDLETNTNCG
jgi:ArsR family transcriptional regulator